LTGLLAALKGLPSTYDKDLQEDKLPVFQAADSLLAIVPVLAGALRAATVHAARMRAAVDMSMLATDVADYLVRKGVTFRDAHRIAGQAVRSASERGVDLDQLPLDAWQALGPFESDLQAVFDPLESVRRRNALGGTAPEAVEAQLRTAQARLDAALPG
jgi:argininosuccinate lyase